MPLSGGDRNLLPINIEDEMKRSYLEYAMSVIVGRALPDVRDGLKPVHRRILFGMHEMGLTPNRPTRKCAKIIGEVMGKYHPHGDAPIYDALVRMAQPFTMRYPRWKARGISAPLMAPPPRPCGTPKPASPASPPRCWRISTRKRSISAPTTTRANRSPRCCPRACPTC